MVNRYGRIVNFNNKPTFFFLYNVTPTRRFSLMFIKTKISIIFLSYLKSKNSFTNISEIIHNIVIFVNTTQKTGVSIKKSMENYEVLVMQYQNIYY